MNSSTDADSAYGSCNSNTSNVSLTSSALEYRYENGRSYHSHHEGKYVLPNDQTEQDRQDLQHYIYRHCLGGDLHRAPLRNPNRVLDIGTGTGIWAVEFADMYPEAEVIGTDLSPIQPNLVPPNLRFYVDDFEESLEFSHPFDYIHWRSLSGSTADWIKLYAQAMQNLKPGGWLEVQEYDFSVYGEDETFDRATWTKKWCRDLVDASTTFGKRLDVTAMHRGWMEKAGFLDVREEVYKIPIGTWARDPKLKEIGHYSRAHMLLTIEAYGMALYTRELHYSLDEARTLFAKVEQEILDKSLHLYTIYRCLYGRSPEHGTKHLASDTAFICS